jgi:arginyl-tRNA synthetase
MIDDLAQSLNDACKQLFDVNVKAELTRPEEQFGDFATNISLILGKQLDKNPREIAEQLTKHLKDKTGDLLEDVSVAGPGFINLKLSDKSLIESLQNKPKKIYLDKVVVIEYSDPNPFKVLHAGHLYTTIVGDAIANLLELVGATAHRVNYGGDVGLHVAKTMWAIIQDFGGEDPSKLEKIDSDHRADWLAEAYVKGNNAYEEADEKLIAQIKQLNKQIYDLHSNNDHESNLARLYWTCRDWSYQAFNDFYVRLGTSMEKYYPESEVADLGLNLVKENIGKVFKESNGAIIFDGEAYGLHTRVFVNQQGLPTYEAKEVGLIVKKSEDYNFDRSVVITANEQAQYMAVVYKAMEQFLPNLVKASIYIPHGMVRLVGGTKMSSRKGNIVRATDVIDVTAEASQTLVGKQADITTLGAIKYAFLKSRLGGDIIYDSHESVSLEGNSGPYLQYAHARAKSIIDKTSAEIIAISSISQLEPGERSLVLKLSQYAETIDKSVNELLPHHICSYLYELCQVFNRFYEYSRVIGDPRQDLRLALVNSYADTLKAGLGILGIEAPDKL